MSRRTPKDIKRMLEGSINNAEGHRDQYQVKPLFYCIWLFVKH